MSDNPTPRPYECPSCGKTHLRCLGHRRRDGEPCGQQPLNGCDVCGDHGAKAPQVKAAADKRVEEGNARRAVVTFGLPQNIDPHDALVEELARTNGHVLWLAQVVQSLEERELTWGLTGTESQEGHGPEAGSYERQTYGAGINVWVQLYQAERKHLTHVAAEAIKAGIAERSIRLAEGMGQLIAQVLRATVADPDLGLPEDRQEVALRVVSRHLRALPAAS